MYGTPTAVVFNNATYYYLTNLQGDVVALLNASGEKVVEYTYDAWGKILTTTGNLASTLGTLNPLRYRGYVYDTETQLYYLQSRYYDPEMGRFINADAFASTGQGLLGNNMFTYCISNPVNCIDASGNRCVAVRDFGGGYALGFSTSGFDPNGSFSVGKKDVDILDLSSFSLLKEIQKVSAGTKTSTFLTGGFDAYSIDTDGLNLLSFSLTCISIDLENQNYVLSLFDLGNVYASTGIGLLPYASAMVSLWSPSVAFPINNKKVTFSLHICALGVGYKFTSSESQFIYAKGFGFSLGIT